MVSKILSVVLLLFALIIIVGSSQNHFFNTQNSAQNQPQNQQNVFKNKKLALNGSIDAPLFNLAKINQNTPIENYFESAPSNKKTDKTKTFTEFINSTLLPSALKSLASTPESAEQECCEQTTGFDDITRSTSLMALSVLLGEDCGGPEAWREECYGRDCWGIGVQKPNVECCDENNVWHYDCIGNSGDMPGCCRGHCECAECRELEKWEPDVCCTDDPTCPFFGREPPGCYSTDGHWERWTPSCGDADCEVIRENAICDAWSCQTQCEDDYGENTAYLWDSISQECGCGVAIGTPDEPGVPKTCTTDADCEDSNTCSIDECINSFCHYSPIPGEHLECIRSTCSLVENNLYVCTDEEECSDKTAGDPCRRGICPLGTGYCSVAHLQSTFGAYAEEASQICECESHHNKLAINDSCLKCANGIDDDSDGLIDWDDPNCDGATADYSIGLFQINLLGRCPEGIWWRPKAAIGGVIYGQCAITDQDALDACKSFLLNPDNNIRRAFEISRGGTNWCLWGCGYFCELCRASSPPPPPPPPPPIEFACPVNTDFDVTCNFGGYIGHDGTDLGRCGAAYCGKPVYAVTDGVALHFNNPGGWGTTIQLYSDEGDYYFVYAHLQDRVVGSGSHVSKGQLIGHTGRTGRVSPSGPAGCHLHLEIRKNNVVVNPENEIDCIIEADFCPSLCAG